MRTRSIWNWQVIQPAVWLTLGLVASFVYLYGPAFAATDLTATERVPVPLFPSQAVILSVLLLTPRRWWWLYLLVYYVLQVIQGAFSGLTLWYGLISNLANVLEPLLGALLLARFSTLPPRFARLAEVGTYVACVTVGSIVGATWGAATRAAAGYPFGESWIGWFLADVIASLILAPTIVLWATAGWRGLRPGSRARLVEAVGLSLTLAVLCTLAFGTTIESAEAAPALLYLPIPGLIWAAVRFGPRGAVTALSFVTVVAIAGAANQLGPFVATSTEASVFTIQVFLLGVGVPLVCLAALVLEGQEAQLRLRQSEQRYRTAVRNLPNTAVLLFDSDARHVFADGRGLSQLGLSPSAIEGKNALEAFPPEIAAVLAPQYAAALAGNEVSLDLVYQTRTYQVQLQPVRNGGRAGGMVILQEITEQRRAEVLAELDRTRTVFFSNVSHEFRTPLTLLIGPLEEALVHAESPLQRERLETAERNANRLLKLTNALLDFARIEAGRMDATFEPVDLPSLTADLAGAFRSAIDLAGLRLVVDCRPLPDGVEVYVDRDLWEKVVLNLLSNALKFTFTGEIGVTLRAVDRGARVELRVRDTGVGIPPEALPRLFDRFYRVRAQRARTQDGSGIGLALVQELVRLHGGTIGVTSQLGVGTEFVVSVPTGHAHLPADRLRSPQDAAAPAHATRAFVDEAIRWSIDAGSPEPHIVPREDVPRVLVADDNADVRTYLARLLGRDYAVDTTRDGASALQSIRENPPDLVIADIVMPRLDGLSLVRAIREDPRTEALPVLLLSARAGEEARVMGLDAGADDYLAKPFAARELVARVGAHLALQKQRERMLLAERSARAEAEVARQTAERVSMRAVSIQAVTTALANAATLRDVGEAVIHHALPVLGAATGMLLLRTDDDDVLTMVAPTGYANSAENQYTRVPLDASLPAAEVVRTLEPLWIESASRVGERFPYWTSRPTGNQAVAALPLLVDDRSVGALVVGFHDERVFAPEDRSFLLILSGQCAAAVHRVQLHDTADAARRQAELALRTRDEFLRTLAHDLKTPLTSLIWHVQVLARGARAESVDSSRLVSTVGAVEASARELMLDIDELRDLVRQQEGASLTLHAGPIDLVTFVGDVVSTTGAASQRLVRVVSAERSVMVDGDRQRLQRALGNLLDNAFKYSPNDSEVVVTVDYAERDGQRWAQVSVQDHGIGIPTADMPFVFDRYHRGANVIDRTAGEGIGLASARQLVESHGGRLTVTSEEGVGSTFIMALPAVPVQAAQAVDGIATPR